jgi:Zn finger protein HypA/HybF involved in hydrogenase expression
MFGLTLHDVATGTHPIGIECEHCIRRVVVTAAALKATPGDRRTLQEAGLVCSKCGSRSFEVTRFLSQAELRTFVRTR